MKKFKKFLDKKKKISSVSEEERFMYEVCHSHTLQVYPTCWNNQYYQLTYCVQCYAFILLFVLLDCIPDEAVKGEALH